MRPRFSRSRRLAEQLPSDAASQPGAVPPPAPGPGRLALRCTGLTKRYPGVLALDRLDFLAQAGQVHAILGENGAGKSTFIKCLGGSVIADAGEVELDGTTVAIGSPADARKRGIEVAYQELSLVPDLTVAENIWLRRARPTRLRTLPRGELRARTRALLERLDAPAIDPDFRVRYLSLAERQVVEVVSALAGDPKIVIFDESTASLPADETRWALGLARRLAGEGRLVLFISHRLPEIRQVADWVTILRDGRSVVSATVGELTDGQMVEAMLGRKPQRLYPPREVAPTDRINLALAGVSVGERLSDIALELHEGEILGIGGLQGQSQSTLLAALFGLVRYRGTVMVSGRRARIRSPRDAFRAGIGIALIPEDRRNQGLLGPKTVGENIVLPILSRLTSRGLLSGRRQDEVVRDAIARLHIRASGPDQPVMTLSGGNQQKVVIAKLLQVGARVLLFHDVTRGIDVGTKAQIFELARRLAAGGHSILFYSSDNQELVHMCDRVMVLSRGRVAAMLGEGELSEENIVRAAFAVRSVTEVGQTSSAAHVGPEA